MSIDRIEMLIKESSHPKDWETIEKAHQLLKKELDDFSFLAKKTHYDIAMTHALQAVEESSLPAFIAASLFFGLYPEKKNIYNDIRKELGEETELYVRCYDFVREKFTESKDEIHFQHSYNTALKMSSIRIDPATICAAMLHEVPRYTKTSFDEMSKNFGHEVAELVQKYQKIDYSYKLINNPNYISHLREMVVSMAQDLRVIIIKMCSNIDRMKNMPEHLEEMRKTKATESLEILAPIANILGIWRLRWQLEDHAFKILHPNEYEKIARRFNVDERKNREQYIEKTRSIVLKSAKEAGIVCHLDGRFKHFYSIYQKMLYKNKSFNEISDVFALRIIVNSIDECYRMLGIIHRLWKPKPRRIKDYIASPKDNDYKSLHTTVFGINNRLTEFQIRTQEMDDNAKFGIAAHWRYKNPKEKVPNWILDLLNEQQKSQNDREFFTKFTSELIVNRIYVYTPKGDIISLPANATPVDFAYHIHTALGNKCAGAIVNEIPVPLNHQLSTNDIVEIIVDRQQTGPKAEWLSFVKSRAAKKHIEEYINKQPLERNFRL